MPIYTSIRSAFDGLSGSWVDMLSGAPARAENRQDTVVQNRSRASAARRTLWNGSRRLQPKHSLAMRAARFVSQRVHHAAHELLALFGHSCVANVLFAPGRDIPSGLISV